MKKATVYSKRKKKTERMQLFIDAETKQHLYDASAHTGTAASEIVRQALHEELNTKYIKFKKDTDSELQ